MTHFFISDPHFWHSRIIEFCRPQFSSLEEMNQTIIDNINKTCGKDDMLFLLGDVVLSTNSEEDIRNTLGQIQCKVNIILGNHDTAPKIKEYEKYAHKILGCMEYPKLNAILTHIPVHTSQLDERFKLNIHGHLHDQNVLKENGEKDERYINVSCEQLNFTPISKDEIRELYYKF